MQRAVLSDPAADHAWQAARERLRHYLDALQMPRREASPLIEQALCRAVRSGEPPLSASMAALLELLGTPQAPPAPLPRRTVMVPEQIERSPRRLFTEALRTSLHSAARLAAAQRQRLMFLGSGLVLGLLLQHLG